MLRDTHGKRAMKKGIGADASITVEISIAHGTLDIVSVPLIVANMRKLDRKI